jgi:hypothetical protein
MLKDFYSHGLPEASMRSRWCRDPDSERWWLPWEVHAILNTLDGHQLYQSVADLNLYDLLAELELGLGLVTGKWEDELFPETWAIKGHTNSCTWGETTCDRTRYYSLTPRGQQWLKTLPARARPPRWKRPTWWIGVVFWTTATFLVLRGFLAVV